MPKYPSYQSLICIQTTLQIDISLDENEEYKKLLLEKSGSRTIPKVFVNDEYKAVCHIYSQLAFGLAACKFTVIL